MAEMGLTAQARLRTEGAVIGAFLGAAVGAIAILALLSAGVHPEHQPMSISSSGNAVVWSGTWQAPLFTSASSRRRLEDEYRPSTCRHAKARGLFELLGLTPSTLAQLEVELAAWQIKKLPPVVRRKASKTILADVFVRIQQHMYRMGLLPLSSWGLGRDTRDLHQILPTLSYQYFYQRHANLVPPDAMCLAFSSDGKMERAAVPNCASDKYWSLEFRMTDHPSVFRHRAQAGGLTARGKVLAGDLTRMSNASLPDVVRHRFDMIFCHEVFEHVARPFDAARGLYNLLRPGGLVFFHAPFLVHRHGKLGKTAAGDPFGFYFQYSPGGVRQMLLDAGFEILSVESMGNGMTATGLLMGFGPADFDPSELSAAIGSSQEGVKPGIFTSSAVVARKPQQ